LLEPESVLLLLAAIGLEWLKDAELFRCCCKVVAIGVTEFLVNLGTLLNERRTFDIALRRVSSFSARTSAR